ncbi:MAG TPA: hypothetical protein VGK19_00165 [Capsulimonadaceae bacterium]|jgi:hypothetical protein
MSEEAEEVQEGQEAPPPVRREVLTWKQKAIRTYEHRQVAREQQAAMMRGKNIDQFRDALGQLLGKEYEVTDFRAEIEGVVFIGHPAQAGQSTSCEIEIEFTCPVCNGPQTQTVKSLGDIGAILCGAAEEHEDCPAKPKAKEVEAELTPEQKLIESLKVFLADLFEEA